MPDGDGAPPTGCARYPGVVFCDDFDVGDDGGRSPLWNAILPAGLGIERSGFSPPFAFVATSPANVGQGSSLGFDGRPQLLEAKKKVRISLSVRVDQSQPDSYACVMAYGPTGITAKHHLRLLVTASGLYVQEYKSALPAEHPDRTFAGRNQDGQWSRVVLEIDYAVTPHTYKLVVNDTPIVTAQEMFPDFPVPSSTSILTGVVFSGSPSGDAGPDGATWGISIDDFVWESE